MAIRKIISRSITDGTIAAADIANNTITNTSLTTVTPIAVFVKGPFALNSLITAIAEEGERATKIVAIKIPIDIFSAKFISTIKGMYSLAKKTPRTPSTKVITNCPRVFQSMLLN